MLFKIVPKKIDCIAEIESNSPLDALVKWIDTQMDPDMGRYFEALPAGEDEPYAINQWGKRLYVGDEIVFNTIGITGTDNSTGIITDIIDKTTIQFRDHSSGLIETGASNFYMRPGPTKTE